MLGNSSGIVPIRTYMPHVITSCHASQVSDMLNPEFFVGAYQRADGSWQHTSYSDTPPADFGEAAATRICERRPLYCVPIPCEAPWAAARWRGQPPEPQTPSER